MTPERWYMISLSQERTLTGEKLFVWTYQPCHLWMRWTLVDPRIHKVPITRRGLTTMSDFYYCFDVYEDNEQQEERDTFLHTFIKEPWPYCEKRYFYFHGQINGVNSPSTSPIFEKHPIKPAFGLCRVGEYGVHYPCLVPEPKVGEEVPDDDATYRTIAALASGAWTYCIEHYEGDDFPISKVEIYCRARQLPGTTRCPRYFYPRLHHWDTNSWYGPEDKTWATEEYQTAMATFLTNPRTGDPWTRNGLNAFNIAFRAGSGLSEHYIYGETRLTWLQVRIYRD